MSDRVIMFVFAGRRENMEIQLPYVRRILDQNPDVEYHVWNLARTQEDRDYLQTISSNRIRVINSLAGDKPWERFNKVYQHYADSIYRGDHFVKLDDDVVFIDADLFAQFIGASKRNPDAITSARVINNGACTSTDRDLWSAFRQLRIRLLDVHMSGKYALASHHHFRDNWTQMLGGAMEPIPTQDWLSINFISYDWPMATRIADLLGTPSPRRIAGRVFAPRDRLGDEGLVNTLPRLIVPGFTVAHLTFGPQERKLTRAQIVDLRADYENIAVKYLA